jgi:integrase
LSVRRTTRLAFGTWLPAAGYAGYGHAEVAEDGLHHGARVGAVHGSGGDGGQGADDGRGVGVADQVGVADSGAAYPAGEQRDRGGERCPGRGCASGWPRRRRSGRLWLPCVARQHRIYAALREFLNHLWKQRRVITFNPVFAVELEAEVTPEGQRWTAAEALRFLKYTQDRPLGLLFRTVVLRGTRRGEGLGFRWSGADLDAGYLAVESTILQHGGAVTEGRAKTRAGERRIYLDGESVRRYRVHRREQLAERLRASTAWQDNDLIFCRADGSPWPPDYVSRLWKRYAREAGVPVIKLHEGRHSAASLARDAGVDPKIRREQLGHTTAAMTDRYTHVLAEAHLEAAEAVARLVGEAGA